MNEFDVTMAALATTGFVLCIFFIWYTFQWLKEKG
jgi:hypothetical protein